MYRQLDILKFENREEFEELEEAEDFEEFPYTPEATRNTLFEERYIHKKIEEWEKDDGNDWVPYDEIKDLYENLLNGISSLTFNDFEQAAIAMGVATRNTRFAVATRNTRLYEKYEKFNSIFYSVRKDEILIKSMTGSGSAHFIVFKEGYSLKEIKTIENIFKRKDCWTKITSFCHKPNKIEGINARF